MKKAEKRVVLTEHARETLLNCRVMYEAIFGRKMNGPEATEAAANALQQWLENFVASNNGILRGLEYGAAERVLSETGATRKIWFQQVGQNREWVSWTLPCREAEAGEYRPPHIERYLEDGDG